MTAKKIDISILEWHRLAKEGTMLPMRILINGVSMFPLIRRKTDYVTIVPIDRTPVTGEIVLFSDEGSERYVLHRVIKIKNGAVLTRGDNCPASDGWMPEENIWGRVVRIERGRWEIIPNAKRGMLWAKIWHFIGKGYRLTVRIMYAAYKQIRSKLV